MLVPAVAALAFAFPSPPATIAPAGFQIFAYAGDAAGGGMVARQRLSAPKGVEIEQRTAHAGWSAPTLVAGSDGRSVLPVVAAAGQHAAAVAWRQDSPKPFSAIRVAIQDPIAPLPPGADVVIGPPAPAAPPPLGAPFTLTATGGVRAPAIGVGPNGDVV